jgi:REP element-mobilizing transposase RayT
MPEPIVIAYHRIWTAYGWWLPNDPRGSGSRSLHNDVFAELGDLHFGRKAVQPMGRVVREFYREAAPLLRFELKQFTPIERQWIGVAIDRAIAAEKYTCYACAVMPDHVHILIRKHRQSAEPITDVLKNASRDRIRESDSWPSDHPVWGGGGWKVFLDHPDEVRRTIRYIERNPLPLSESVQSWPFVKAYDGWPLHPGHSPNSPYAKRLRAVGRYP